MCSLVDSCRTSVLVTSGQVMKSPFESPQKQLSPLGPIPITALSPLPKAMADPRFIGISVLQSFLEPSLQCACLEITLCSPSLFYHSESLELLLFQHNLLFFPAPVACGISGARIRTLATRWTQAVAVTTPYPEPTAARQNASKSACERTWVSDLQHLPRSGLLKNNHQLLLAGIGTPLGAVCLCLCVCRIKNTL